MEADFVCAHCKEYGDTFAVDFDFKNQGWCYPDQCSDSEIMQDLEKEMDLFSDGIGFDCAVHSLNNVRITDSNPSNDYVQDNGDDNDQIQGQGQDEFVPNDTENDED